VKEKKRQIKEAEKQEILVRKGAIWIDNVLNSKNGSTAPGDDESIQILMDYFLFQNDSNTFQTARKIIKRSSINSPEQLFSVFVKAGIWNQNENVELLALKIPTAFNQAVLDQEKRLTTSPVSFLDDPLREDLTHIPLITIDGQSTLDFDDALSLETTDTGYAPWYSYHRCGCLY
jgi:exoribonuclease-2